MWRVGGAAVSSEGVGGGVGEVDDGLGIERQ